MTASSIQPHVNLQKQRRGVQRLCHAAAHSWAGLRVGWAESAFRLEVLIVAVLLPGSAWLGRTWLEAALLAAVLALVLVVELLNTAIETTIDRIGPEWHELSRRAKDVGSAAVLLSLLLAAGVWLAALASRFGST